MVNDCPVLSIESIAFGYTASKPLFQNLSLTMNAGERIAILGESGIGKSSLLRVISGLEKILSGTIAIQGRTVSSSQHHQHPSLRNVGMVFQDWAVFPHLTVFQNVAFGLRRCGKTEHERNHVHALLASFELTEFASRSPNTLSGGQLQRVACARALAPQPAILLLDEAFSCLNTSLRQKVRTQFIEASQNTSCILVTHDEQEAHEFGQRVFEFQSHGLKTIEPGGARSVRQSPPASSQHCSC
jgi:iron(III) transport system ATP-binding protein